MSCLEQKLVAGLYLQLWYETVFLVARLLTAAPCDRNSRELIITEQGLECAGKLVNY